VNRNSELFWVLGLATFVFHWEWRWRSVWRGGANKKRIASGSFEETSGEMTGRPERKSKKEYDLMGNAEDSLAHAVEHLTENVPPGSGDYKRAILDVTHVIELLLKERLRRAHPAFIWQDIDMYPDENRKTVDTITAVNRLSKLVGIKLPEEDISIIRKARGLRNRIEHYAYTFEEKESRIIIGRLLSLIFNFTSKQLNTNWEAGFRSNGKWKALIDDFEFWYAHSSVVEKRVVEEKRDVIDCPSCGATTFDITDEECVLCTHKEEVGTCSHCGEAKPISLMNDMDDSDYWEEKSSLFCEECWDEMMAFDG